MATLTERSQVCRPTQAPRTWRQTVSLCPQCLATIPAELAIQNGRMLMYKDCLGWPAIPLLHLQLRALLSGPGGRTLRPDGQTSTRANATAITARDAGSTELAEVGDGRPRLIRTPGPIEGPVIIVNPGQRPLRIWSRLR